MEGYRKRTPIPKREVERESSKSGPVMTYTLSPEEVEKRIANDHLNDVERERCRV